MYIGTALVLIAVGAVLTFAVTSEPFPNFISLDVVGIILMIVGVIGAIYAMAVVRPRRTTEVTHAPVREREIVRDRDVY